MWGMGVILCVRWLSVHFLWQRVLLFHRTVSTHPRCVIHRSYRLLLLHLEEVWMLFSTGLTCPRRVSIVGSIGICGVGFPPNPLCLLVLQFSLLVELIPVLAFEVRLSRDDFKFFLLKVPNQTPLSGMVFLCTRVVLNMCTHGLT